MYADAANHVNDAELREAIRRRIALRTNRRVESLEVSVIENQIVIGGRAPSSHVKQLALLGVLDVLRSRAAMRVRLNIDVVSDSRDRQYEVGRA